MTQFNISPPPPPPQLLRISFALSMVNTFLEEVRMHNDSRPRSTAPTSGCTVKSKERTFPGKFRSSNYNRAYEYRFLNVYKTGIVSTHVKLNETMDHNDISAEMPFPRDEW